jgi:hypothetical protein
MIFFFILTGADAQIALYQLLELSYPQLIYSRSK